MSNIRHNIFCPVFLVVLLSSVFAVAQSWNWRVVVNNAVTVPGDTRAFNSYNQPSVNINQMVVFRARSKGGQNGEPAHGVWMRDMKLQTPLKTIFDRNTLVPQPNNLGTTFVEPPAFPRIDITSNTVASRGNHQPAWKYQVLVDGALTDTRGGTTGIYANPFGDLILGASNLGTAPDLQYFAVPDKNGIKFDVFPGAPSVANDNMIVFKGNFSEPDLNNPDVMISKTGVYFRNLRNNGIRLSDGTTLEPAGGMRPVVVIADSDTRIPGTATNFGSTAPPSAAGYLAVFAGFDNEDNPTKGGIYLAPLLISKPPLIPLVKIGGQVPGEQRGVGFNKLGEGLSYDGRFVAFWGAWGTETKDLVLQCPQDGNKERVAYCQKLYGDGINPGEVSAGFHTTVPLHQGIFVHDILLGVTKALAKSPGDFDDFVYWNFSGMVPGVGESDDAGEPARWRSGSFMAVSGLVDGTLLDRNFHVAFKARTGQIIDGAYTNPVDGIYLRKGGASLSAIMPMVESGIDGTLVDPAAIYTDEENPDAPAIHLPVTEMGIERDGFRGKTIAISVTMGTEEAGWAGVYLTTVPNN